MTTQNDQPERPIWMYSDLLQQNTRPEPFSRYTTNTLWTDPWIAGRMLKNHLDQNHDMASRRGAVIEGIVAWMDRRPGLTGKAVCDLGCGPGLYAMRMAEKGASVIGVDFSGVSIVHARAEAAAKGADIRYLQADYLRDDLPDDQDLVTLIYGDFCTLSPEKRQLLLTRIRAMLKPGGRLVFDVFTTPQFDARQESASYGRRPMGDFWSPEDHFGFQNTFLYPEQKIALDRYLILTPTRVLEVFNWMQYYDPKTVSAELAQAGLMVEATLSAISGEDWHGAAEEMAIIARV